MESLQNVALTSFSHRDIYTLDDDYIDGLWASRALTLAGLVILVYEYLETFSDEVEYIWFARWTTIRIIFTCNRYGSLICVALITANMSGWWNSKKRMFCLDWTVFQSVYILLSLTSIQIIVLMRAWVVWGRRRDVLTVLLTIFLVCALVCVGILTWGIIISGYDSYPLASVVGTCVGYIPKNMWTIWLPSMFEESVVFLVTMATIRHHNLSFQYAGRSPVIRVLYRDAITYFVVILFSNLFNILVWVWDGNSSRNMLANSFTTCLINVTGQRLVLDLRKIDTTTEYTTTRIDREIDRAIRGIDHQRSRSASPIVFEMQPRRSGRESQSQVETVFRTVEVGRRGRRRGREDRYGGGGLDEVVEGEHTDVETDNGMEMLEVRSDETFRKGDLEIGEVTTFGTVSSLTRVDHTPYDFTGVT